MRAKAILVDWTPERIQSLRQMALAGKTSYQIAAELGISRGAVCKKLWIMGLKLRGRDRYRNTGDKVYYDKNNPLALNFFVDSPNPLA